MASSLIYRTIRRNLPFGIVLAGLITAALVVLGAGITADVFGNAGGKSAFLIFLVAVIAPYLANRITQARKTQRLQADHQAAILVGKEEFISVLKKIDGLGISDVKKTEERRIRQHFSSRPSVTERLSNLSLIK